MVDFFDKSQRLYLSKENHIGRLVLNRPEKHNAMSLGMWQQLPSYLKVLESDADVRVVIIGSADNEAFCAGADIEEMGLFAEDEEKKEENRIAIRSGQQALARFKKMIIAKISGSCFGAGCGIATYCDFRFADTTARFGVTPAKLGLVYPLGDTKRLIDLVGIGYTRDILFTARTFSAKQAFDMGLITALYAPDDLEQEVEEAALHMVKLSQYSLQGMKKIIHRIQEGQMDDDAITAKMFTDAYGGVDHQEGCAAFMQKRAPNFVKPE